MTEQERGPSTMSNLDELERLLEAATPGPWAVGSWTGQCHKHATGKHPGEPECKYDYMPWEYGDGHLIRGGDAGGQVAGNYDYEEGGIVEPSDAALIVAAVNSLPALIAAARAAQEVADTPPGNLGFIEKWQRLRATLTGEGAPR